MPDKCEICGRSYASYDEGHTPNASTCLVNQLSDAKWAVQRLRAADTGEWIKPGSDKSTFIGALDSLYKTVLK